MNNNLFYKPSDAWCGDFIPFYKDGLFRLFYIHDRRDKEKYGEGRPWHQVVTSDFVHFEDLGEMIPAGTVEEQDLHVFTGSVLEADGKYHIFYTGHNPYYPKAGKPQQAIMHAVSDDLVKWTKVHEDSFFAPTENYEKDDWRDPYVYWDEEDQVYYMLLAARLKEGPSRRRGCIALCKSTDLRQWEVCEPFWSPGLYYTHECPDLFKIGGWWYLVYSAFSDNFLTYYRKSRSPKGPWIVPDNEMVDGRAFYAAKTVSDGNRRFLVGWNPTREGERDYTQWHWGGSLVAHELEQSIDGDLAIKPIEEIVQQFKSLSTCEFNHRWGNWTSTDDCMNASPVDGYACALSEVMPETCLISGYITFDEHVRDCGIMLRASDNMDDAYYIRLEPKQQRITFDSWPRMRDVPQMVELERSVKLIAGIKYKITMIVSSTICEVYFDNKIALSARMYNLPQGRMGIFVSMGNASFENMDISSL